MAVSTNSCLTYCNRICICRLVNFILEDKWLRSQCGPKTDQHFFLKKTNHAAYYLRRNRNSIGGSFCLEDQRLFLLKNCKFHCFQLIHIPVERRSDLSSRVFTKREETKNLQKLIVIEFHSQTLTEWEEKLTLFSKGKQKDKKQTMLPLHLDDTLTKVYQSYFSKIL